MLSNHIAYAAEKIPSPTQRLACIFAQLAGFSFDTSAGAGKHIGASSHSHADTGGRNRGGSPVHGVTSQELICLPSMPAQITINNCLLAKLCKKAIVDKKVNQSFFKNNFAQARQ